MHRELNDFVQGISSQNWQIKDQAIQNWRSLLYKVVHGESEQQPDLVRAYFQLEKLELFEAWDYILGNQLKSTSLIDVIAFTITAARLLGFRSIGSQMVRKIMTEYLTQIYRYLNSGSHALIASTLRLLVSMVMHGSTTTKELHANFNFSLKSLSSFLRIRKKSKKSSEKDDSNLSRSEDVRTLYIKFVLGFFIRGDASVKKSLLDIKGLVAFILADIKHDSYELIEFILETLLKGLIDDKFLARSPKISFFKPFVLEKLLDLYSLNDPSNARNCSKKEPKRTIADLVHHFMQRICLNPGSGICYEDNGYYNASIKYENIIEENSRGNKVFNIVLLNFLKTLRISTDLKQRDLFLCIMRQTSELVHAYISLLTSYSFWSSNPNLSFEPRSSIHYLANVSLVTSIINSEVPSLFGWKDMTHAQLPPPYKNCLSNILPGILTKQLNSKALMLQSKDLRYAAGQLLNASFLKLSNVLETAEKVKENLRNQKKFAPKITDQALTHWTKWQEQLLFEYRKQLPDSQIIISLFAKIDLSQEGDEIDQQEYHSTILMLLKNYEKFNRENLHETRFDFGRIIPKDFDVTLVIQKHVLDVLECVHDFNWFSKAASSSPLTYFGILLSLAIETADPDIKFQAQNILQKRLQCSFLFQDTDRYINLFFDSLKSVPKKECKDVLKWVDRCFMDDSRSPFKLVERIMRLKDIDENISVNDLSHNPCLFPPVLICLVDGLSQQECPKIAIFFLMRFIRVLLPATGTHDAVCELNDMLQKIGEPIGNFIERLSNNYEKYLTKLSWKKGVIFSEN